MVMASEERNASTVIDTITERILQRILAHRGAPADMPVGAVHRDNIRAAVSAGEPVVLVLPAFPAKSPNRDKTTGALPDLGEVVGLKRLNATCEDISAFYAPGAQAVICSDGRLFSDLVQVSDDEISAYRDEIERIILGHDLQHLSTFHLEDQLPTLSFDGMRAALVERYGRSIDEVKEHVRASRSARSMFNGVHRFLFEDEVVLHPEVSRSKARKRTKERVYGIIQRSNAWGRFIAAMFPGAVRLSIHPQGPASAKIAFQLVHCPNYWITPWHASPLWDGEKVTLVKSAEAREMGATRYLYEGRYAYFSAVGPIPA